MEILTDPLPTQLFTVAHTDTQESDKCTDADAGRLRHKPQIQSGTRTTVDRGLPQKVSLTVPQERELTKETKTLKHGQGGRAEFWLTEETSQPKNTTFPWEWSLRQQHLLRTPKVSYARKEL